MARFTNEMVAEATQPFWAALQRGEFIADAAVEAGTYRKQGTRWVAACGGVAGADRRPGGGLRNARAPRGRLGVGPRRLPVCHVHLRCAPNQPVGGDRWSGFMQSRMMEPSASGRFSARAACRCRSRAPCHSAS